MMEKHINSPTTLVWFRRDLRVFDHRALQYAVQQKRPIVALFIFDREILDPLPNEDRRLTFIHETVAELKASLAEKGVPLYVLEGLPKNIIPELADKIGAVEVVSAEDYEPDAIMRDAAVAQRLEVLGIAFTQVKDQVIFAKNEVMTQKETPFHVFTPYYRRWMAKLYAGAIDCQQDNWAQLADNQKALPAAFQPPPEMPTLEALGFTPQTLLLSGVETSAQALLEDFLTRIDRYHLARDFPSKKGVSYLSVHVRFGTLSIRHLVTLALEADNEGAQVWLKELVWREFYQQFLTHYPNVVRESFKEEYRDLKWENNEAWFECWKAGQTGYPLIDAAMRQLLHSGYMHNRLRMIVASFLVKDLLIDWRWGEAWFAKMLLDFDLAANNGGWQWAASTGCDAQPYFRIFNPITQSEKFDPSGDFIRRYVPEIAHLDNKSIHAPWLSKTHKKPLNYPDPIVDHKTQRLKALELFKI